jgi:hypothetical protein
LAAAKGIKVGYVANKQVSAPPDNSRGGIINDDRGTPELAKIQPIGFTILALAIFLTTVAHEIVAATGTESHLTLPDIDSTLMALREINQGGYLAKELTTRTTEP